MSKAQRMEDRCAYASIGFYSLMVGMGIAGFVLAAYGRNVPAIFFGAASLASAVLCFLTARASRRWRKTR